MLTKKHFELMALVIGQSRINSASKERITKEMIKMCKDSNPRFDEKRFRDAINEASREKLSGYDET